MQLIILDKNMDTLGAVSVFNTLIWDRRYYDSGLFELYTPAEFFELMKTGLISASSGKSTLPGTPRAHGRPTARAIFRRSC